MGNNHEFEMAAKVEKVYAKFDTQIHLTVWFLIEPLRLIYYFNYILAMILVTESL